MGLYGRAFLIVVVLFGLLFVAPTGAPLSIGYVTSDSMEPTIGVNDGYIAVPANDIEEGDIVLFWSARQGDYVTHRVVEETPNGYITKGDDNPTTDQAAGFPPIPESAIVAEVLTVGGEPVILPNFGSIVPFIQTYQPIILGLILLLLAAVIIRARRQGSVRGGRDVLKVRDVMIPLFVVTFVTTLAITPLATTTLQLTYFVTDEDVDSGFAVTVGEEATRNVTVDTIDLPLTRHIVTGDGITVTNQADNGSALALTVEVPPIENVGPYRASLTVYPYPAAIPETELRWLHSIHPIVAILTSSLVIYLPLYLLYMVAIDGSRPIVAGRSGYLGRSKGN